MIGFIKKHKIITTIIILLSSGLLFSFLGVGIHIIAMTIAGLILWVLGLLAILMCFINMLEEDSQIDC